MRLFVILARLAVLASSIDCAPGTFRTSTSLTLHAQDAPTERSFAAAIDLCASTGTGFLVEPRTPEVQSLIRSLSEGESGAVSSYREGADGLVGFPMRLGGQKGTPDGAWRWQSDGEGMLMHLYNTYPCV